MADRSMPPSFLHYHRRTSVIPTPGTLGKWQSGGPRRKQEMLRGEPESFPFPPYGHSALWLLEFASYPQSAQGHVSGGLRGICGHGTL